MPIPIWLDPNRSHIQLDSESVLSITSNSVEINPEIEGTIGEITQELSNAFQEKSRELSQFFIGHKGSDLAQLFLSDLRIADHDVQILLFPEPSEKDLERIFSTAQDVMNMALKTLVGKKNPEKEFSPRYPELSYFYGRPNDQGVSSRHFIARLRFPPSRWRHLPLDLSIHIIDSSIKSLSSFNLEAFYMPVGETFRIYSELDGNIYAIINQLQQRILRIHLHEPHKFGFYRYITALTHLGITAPEAGTSEKLLAVDALQGGYMLVEMRKYITEKKLQGPYLLYILNALFQIPESHPLFGWMANECVRETVQFRKDTKQLGFISQALSRYMLTPQENISLSEAKKIVATFKLLILYLSEASSVKMHNNKLHQVCQLSFPEVSFYLIVPFLQEDQDQNLIELITPSFFDSTHHASSELLQNLVKKKQFPYSINHILLSGSFSPECLGLLLKECSTEDLSEEDVAHLLNSIPQFLLLLQGTPFPLQLLIDLFNRYPEKASKNLIYRPIRHTIESYGYDLHQVPSIGWEEMLTLGLLSSDRKENRWRTLFSLILSLPDITFAKPCDEFRAFCRFLFNQGGALSFLKAEFCIKALALLGYDSSIIESLTDFEISEENEQTALNCLGIKQRPEGTSHQEKSVEQLYDPLHFAKHFENFLLSRSLHKAKRLLQYQEIILGGLEFPEVYEKLFKISLEVQYEEIALFSLKRLCSAKENPLEYLYDFHRIFSLAPITLLEVLQTKRKIIRSAYELFHTFPDIANLLEQEILIDGVLDNSESNRSFFEEAIVTRIQQTSFSTGLKLTNLLSNRALVLRALYLLFQKEGPFAQRLSLFKFVLDNFPEHLPALLIEGCTLFEKTLRIHAFILETIKKKDDLLSEKLLQLYFSLFIKQLDVNSEKKGAFLLQIAPYYLSAATDDQRFDLIEKCSSLPLLDFTRHLFDITIQSVKPLKKFLNKYEWHRLHIPYCIDFLRQPLLLDETKEKIFITKLHNLLISCEIHSLEEEHIDFLSEKAHFFIQKIEPLSLLLAIKLLHLKPEKRTLKLTRGSIKQLLDRYQSNLKLMPDLLWEECCELVLLSPHDNKTSWNTLLTNHLMPLLIQCEKSPLNQSIIKFIHLVSERAGPLSIDYHIQAISLLGPNFIPPETLLEFEMDESQIQRVLPYLNEALFSSLVQNGECIKALKILLYREPLTISERPEPYIRLFKKCLERGHRQEAKICLAKFEQLQDPSLFIESLKGYHAVFPLDLEIFYSLLNQNKKLICPVYSHLYNNHSVAELIENEFFHEIIEENLDTENIVKYEIALLSRIKKLLSEKAVESAFILAKRIPQSCLEGEGVFREILVSLFENPASDLIREKALTFASHRFPHLLEDILSLHRDFPKLRNGLFIHQVILEHSMHSIQPLPKDLLDAYAGFYINELETFILSSFKNREALHDLYFSNGSETLRFNFALKCASFPSLSESIKAFHWVTSCKNSLTISLSHHIWKGVEVKKWLHLLPSENSPPFSTLSKEFFVDIILNQITDFTKPGTLDILLEFHPLLMNERELAFIEQYKHSTHPEDLSLLIHPLFSPILLKDPDLYRCFLTSALELVQNCKSEEKNIDSRIKTILKLIQQPTPHDDEDILRFSIAAFCINLLQSYSGSLAWITGYAAKNITCPFMYDHSYQIIRLSPYPKTIIPFLRALTEIMVTAPDEMETIKVLNKYLAALSICRLSERDLIEAAPLFKKIPSFLIASSYSIPQLRILNLSNTFSSGVLISVTEPFEKIMARTYALTPPDLFECSKELIELICQYSHALSSTWDQKETSEQNQASPMQTIENLTIKLHMNKLKIAAHIDESTNCIADLKVYISHLKRIFITKEIEVDLNHPNSNPYLLTYDELITLVRDAKRRFPSEGLEVNKQLLEVISQICGEGITHPLLLDLAIARLALIVCHETDTETPLNPQANNIIRNLFLSINSLENNKTPIPLWSFRKSCDFLRLYRKCAHQNSAYHAFSSVPIYRLPKQFIIKAIQRSYILFTNNVLNKVPRQEILLKADLTCLAISAYFSSAYTIPEGSRAQFIKDIPMNILLSIKCLFPEEEGKEIINSILNEIQIEEQLVGVDYCKTFIADLLER